MKCPVYSSLSSFRARYHIRFSLPVFFASMALLPLSSQAQLTRFPDTPPIGFSWRGVVPGYAPAAYNVQRYWSTNGTPGGPVYTTTTTIHDRTPSHHAIGSTTFQYILWQGAARGGRQAFGAGFFGGFSPTGADKGNWSFLQIYRDTTTTGGKWALDEPYRTPLYPHGRVNGEVTANYGRNPGWDFAGTKYDYLDIPFDNYGDTPETVFFETALVSYDARNVTIYGDWTWSFTTEYMAGTRPEILSGQEVQVQQSASLDLLNLYRAAYPTIQYHPMGASVPEPGLLALLLGLGVSGGGVIARNRFFGRYNRGHGNRTQ